MYNPKETHHTWQKFFQYIIDCRTEIMKTVMGQEKGKSTYSVYPCNASIIICCLRKLLLLLSFASQNWLWQRNRNFELPDKNWALSFDRLILFSAYYIWVCTDIYSNLCILVCIVITYVWSHFLSMYCSSVFAVFDCILIKLAVLEAVWCGLLLCQF